VPVEAVADVEGADIFVFFDQPEGGFFDGFDPVGVGLVEVAVAVVEVFDELFVIIVDFFFVEEGVAAFIVVFGEGFEEAFFVFEGGFDEF